MSSFDLYLDLALVFFLLLVVFNYRVQRSVLYPPFIFCAMWLLDLVVFRLGLIEINPLHGNTLAIVAAGAASFSVGGLLAGLAPWALLRTHIHIFPPNPKRTTDFIRNTLMIVLLCGLPVMFYQTLQLSRSFGGDYLILEQARRALIETSQSEEQSVPLTMMAYFVMAATYTSLLFATEKKDRKFWVVTIVAFVACILSTQRVGLLFLISGLSAIQLLQRKQESLRSAMRLLRWPIALFVVLWTGLIFTNKSTNGMTGSVAGIATNSLLTYLVGPLAAFDSVVQHPAEFAMTTSHVFEYPLRLAAALHLISYTQPPAFDSFVQVPFPINVYTVYKFDFIELGVAGTLALLLFVGLLHSLIYLKARQGGRFSTYMFACSIYPVLMVIFADQYFQKGLDPHSIAFGLIYFLIGSVQIRLFPTNWQRASLMTNSR